MRTPDLHGSSEDISITPRMHGATNRAAVGAGLVPAPKKFSSYSLSFEGFWQRKSIVIQQNILGVSCTSRTP